MDLEEEAIILSPIADCNHPDQPVEEFGAPPAELSLDSLDRIMNEHFNGDSSGPVEVLPKKRGRKKVRPHDPVVVKSEVKDKFWIRRFRREWKQQFREIKPTLSPKDVQFWNQFLNSSCEPGKSSTFNSFNKLYKQFLFTKRTFRNHFTRWFVARGAQALSRKFSPDSDLWKVYYDYAYEELARVGTPDTSKVKHK